MLLSAKSKPLQITTASLLEKFHYAPNMKIIHVHLSEYTPEWGEGGEHDVGAFPLVLRVYRWNLRNDSDCDLVFAFS